MSIHLLALPTTQTTSKYELCGFTQATIRFAKLLRHLNHTVFLYGAEHNEAPCSEFVSCISEEEQRVLLGNTQYQYAATDNSPALWALCNPRMVSAIAKRKQPRDIICTIGGRSQQSVTEAHPDCLALEYSIGYVGSYAPYRVYESHAWRHCTHGFQDSWEGRFFDDVIPLFFDESDFQFRERFNKERFALYVGRLTPRKGIAIACQAAHAAGIPLKVIGHGDTSLVTHGAEYLGPLCNAERNEYMSRATALLCPTQYIEPFGSVAVEAQMCGTPVISTDFGGFTETVDHGRSGFRCNYLGEFVSALRVAKYLDCEYIRERAVRLYSIPQVAKQYDHYFKRLELLWEHGWNSQ
jgi:glycosyltransferase involved in cell wall biosynthesis